jgi:hypothetical protein
VNTMITEEGKAWLDAAMVGSNLPRVEPPAPMDDLRGPDVLIATDMSEDATAALVASFNRSHEHGDMPVLTPGDSQPPRPSTDAVTQTTHNRAARVIERCGYHVSGYVLTDKWGMRKAIVEEGDVRWLPNISDFTKVMKWQDVKGPNTPPDEAIGDELLTSAQQPVTAPPVALAAPPAAPSRPILTAPPTQRLLESAEEALGVLARELGCAYNDLIPHNAGWFVPGKPTAHASALDAIKGLFARLKDGGTAYYPTPAAVATAFMDAVESKPPKKAKSAPAPEAESAQAGLF